MSSSTPPVLTLAGSSLGNGSAYTLATVHRNSPSASSDPVHSPNSPLLTPSIRSYGSTSPQPLSPTIQSSKRAVFNAALKMAVVFIISTVFLGGILWLTLPTLDEHDKLLLRVPKSFGQVQELNGLLKKYRDIYPYRIVVCYVTTYLFLQAFSLPGSMYLSILGGAVWGVPRALPLACTCVATGASLSYMISAALGPAILTLPKWKVRLDAWSTKIQSQKENIISFLIVLRIAPLPPHWVVNVLCPHVGIGLVPFWISTFLGVLGVTVIHTTIGVGLDEMTSVDDFHLVSWRNFFGLSAVVVGVLIPVALRHYYKRDLDVAVDVERVAEGYTEERPALEGEDQVIASGPRVSIKAKKPQLSTLSDDESDDFSYDDSGDSDVILEAGPVMVSKLVDDRSSSSHHDP